MIRKTFANGKTYYAMHDVCKDLGYKQYGDNHRITLGGEIILLPFESSKGTQRLAATTLEGIKRLIHVSRKGKISDEIRELLAESEDVLILQGTREETALRTIEQILDIELERQYHIDGFLVDGYHAASNTVYEIDEHQHYRNGKLIEACVLRQQYLEQKHGCKVVRVKV